MKILKKLFLIALFFGLLAIMLGLGYYLAVTKDARIDEEKLVLRQKNVAVYDKDGEEIKNVSSIITGQTVELSQIPNHTKITFVNIEDKRFYTHNGFDLRRIVKAVYNNLRARAFKEGASTISQQLIKNTHLSQEKTIKRKLQEWKLTRQLERRYSKDEILEKYLNSVYFGHSCFGIKAAADFYFGKDVESLTLGESAILTALVRSPNNYSPFKHPENCEKRKRIVLNTLLTNEKITENEWENAVNEPLPALTKQKRQNTGFLHFVFEELSTIAEEKNVVLGGEIKIYTSMDANLQDFLENLPDTNCDKTALVIDKETGSFRACVASAGNLRRLPGSLLKPLLVYAPAIEENLLSPATPILDEAVNYAGYKPQNHNGVFHGYLSARDCLAKSLNIPAVKILQSLSLPKAAAYLERFGLSVEKEDLSLALALGGMREGYTLQELATAYTALETGEGIECGFIDKITIDGQLVYARNTKKHKILSRETAYLVTDMLKTASKEGTAKKLRALPFDIAAKTGTVGNEKGNTDAYALSYTSKDVAAVWLGNANNEYIEYSGGGVPCNLLFQINDYLYGSHPSAKTPPSFHPPDGVCRVSIDKLSYYDRHTILLADDLSPTEYRMNEWFKKDALPTKKSDFFSAPSILPPTLAFENNKVIITFDEHSPTLYSYKIIRSDYARHTTVYQGKMPVKFVDDTIEKNKHYVYTVIPLYNDTEGTRVVLPSVNTAETSKDDKIVNEEWWEY